MIGEKLKQLRDEKGLSMMDVSRSLEIPQRKLSLFESNNIIPKEDELLKLATFFDKPLPYFLEEIE